jgi:carboxymethylenebutenolidase
VYEDPHDPSVLRNDDGSHVPGFLVPAQPPSVIVVHEVFGLNNQIRGVARRFAAEGFTTFAVDVLDGRVTSDLAAGLKAVTLALNWKRAIEIIRTATGLLRRGGGKVGIIGFSFGGALAVAAAAHIPELAGCVTWYGIPTKERGDINRINCRVQGHFGRFDKQVSNDRVDAFEAKLGDAGVGAEIHRYHAEHDFFNETLKDTFSASNTELSFRRAAAFMKKELTGSY